MSTKGKIINDPVYGFIRFPEPELMEIIEHPWFQRMRHIKQMGMAHLVYPGAVHTRFHHSLGACHLMGKALDELRQKGIAVAADDFLAARIAILMHDIGHGPFSHALEYSLVESPTHEGLSSLIMQRMNQDTGGFMSKAIEIYDQAYPKKYLHQLVSSQLDVDRMDYLNRDSFYTGVSEGVIGYDRILQMLTVRDEELMVEEKAVHSVEKFIIARRLMYWQVYLHKAVLGAEMLLVRILERARELAKQGKELFGTPSLLYFMYSQLTKEDFDKDPAHLERFCELDDTDVMASVKVWQKHEDPILSQLCTMMIRRQLYKVRLSSGPLDEELAQITRDLTARLGLPPEELRYFVFGGTTSTSTYNVADEKIRISLKNGKTVDISEVDNPLVDQAFARPVHKNYICYVQP